MARCGTPFVEGCDTPRSSYYINPLSTTTLSPSSSRLAQRIYHIGLAATWLAVAGAFLFWGLDYYVLPLAERPYAAGHDLFKPTGLVGNRLAVVGTLMLTFGVASYSTRKRWGRLQTFGKLRHWLSFHIFLCTLGPFLITLHTSFKVGGIVSIAFWSMVLVVASGLVGRYVYVRIPKTLNGRFRSMQEIETRQAELLAELSETGALAGDDLAEIKSPHHRRRAASSTPSPSPPASTGRADGRRAGSTACSARAASMSRRGTGSWTRRASTGGSRSSACCSTRSAGSSATGTPSTSRSPSSCSSSSPCTSASPWPSATRGRRVAERLRPLP